MSKIMYFVLFFFILVFPHTILAENGGQWELLQRSVGVSAMHMQLLSDDRVIIFDRTDFGHSNLTLPENECRHDLSDPVLQVDCTAHSVEYNPINNTYRALHILSNTWCSSGAVTPDGKLVQTGGWNDGKRTIRVIQPCPTCDWEEFPNALLQRRWYATNHVLPDGRIIVIGGTLEYNYEFIPRTQLFNLTFLEDTLTEQVPRLIEDNLYPYVFLNVDGNLFIFANNRAILLDYNRNVVVQSYPVIPGGEPRNYPSTGSAVMLPLRNLELGDKIDVEVLICGGAPIGSFAKAMVSQFEPALNTCARIHINDPNATWVMEDMPMGRIMGEMINLPNGDILMINGAGSGVAGWDMGRDPVLTPLIYHPGNTLDSRFEAMAATTIPRMYHSCAILLRDGRILVGGSNPHQFYNFTNVLYPTELSLEAFSPPYLDATKAPSRPVIQEPTPYTQIAYDKNLTVTFSIEGTIFAETIEVTMIRPPFNTHSFSQSQRMLVLTMQNPTKTNNEGVIDVNVVTPMNGNIAPPGFYLLFVVHQGVPSPGVWVQLS